jgi:hypothetical protein
VCSSDLRGRQRRSNDATKKTFAYIGGIKSRD